MVSAPWLRRPFLLPWPGAVRGTCATWGNAVSVAWVGMNKKVRSNLLMSLWAYSRWMEGAVQTGVADGMVNKLRAMMKMMIIVISTLT